jgi:TIR domain
MSTSVRDFDTFLSYKSEEHAWVKQLKQNLVKRGVRVWLDRDSIRPGDLFPAALENGSTTSRAVAVVVTPESLASGWVRKECERARSLAVRGDLQRIPLILRSARLHMRWREWAGWYPPRGQT